MDLQEEEEEEGIITHLAKHVEYVRAAHALSALSASFFPLRLALSVQWCLCFTHGVLR